MLSIQTIKCCSSGKAHFMWASNYCNPNQLFDEFCYQNHVFGFISFDSTLYAIHQMHLAPFAVHFMSLIFYFYKCLHGIFIAPPIRMNKHTLLTEEKISKNICSEYKLSNATELFINIKFMSCRHHNDYHINPTNQITTFMLYVHTFNVCKWKWSEIMIKLTPTFVLILLSSLATAIPLESFICQYVSDQNSFREWNEILMLWNWSFHTKFRFLSRNSHKSLGNWNNVFVYWHFFLSISIRLYCLIISHSSGYIIKFQLSYYVIRSAI